MKDNRASNATYLGPIIFGQIQPAPEDQYQPTAPLYVEQDTVVGNWEPSNFDIYGIQPLEIMEGETFEQMAERLKDAKL